MHCVLTLLHIDTRMPASPDLFKYRQSDDLNFKELRLPLNKNFGSYLKFRPEVRVKSSKRIAVKVTISRPERA